MSSDLTAVSSGGSISGTSGQWTVTSTALEPVTDNTEDLGSASKRVANIWLNASIKNVTSGGDAYSLSCRSDGTGLQFVTEAVTGSAIAFQIQWGAGSPEGVITGRIGSIYLRQDGGANTTLYVKESGTSNTGWVGK